MRTRKWMRPSLRAMLGTIMLLCGLFATWNVCEQRAIADVNAASGGYPPQFVAPYVLCIEKSDNVTVISTYHVWCFGLMFDLPYSRRLPKTGGLVFGGARPRIIIPEDEPQLL